MTHDFDAGIEVLQRLRALAVKTGQRRLAVLSGKADWSRRVAARLLARYPEAERLYIGEPGTMSVRAVDYPRARTQLGTEVELLVYDAWSGFDPDALGALSGTVIGGGLILLLTPCLDQWPDRPDPAAERIAIAGYDVARAGSRFLHRFIRVIRADPGCWVWREHDPPPAVPVLQEPTPIPVPDDPACLTPDQSRAVSRVTDLGRRPGAHALVLTADRGRGKSAALGIASGRLMGRDGYRIVVTAPRSRSAAGVFEHARSTQPTARLQGGMLQLGEASMDYTAPDALLDDPPAADLLLVDEAAGIPAPMLEGLLRRFPRVVFATTVHGYEGTGRGFAIRFADTLARLRPGYENLRLENPVRWAPGDPVERFITDALLLDAEPAAADCLATGVSSPVRYQRLNRDRLVEDEPLLRQVFGLLVNAHYRTTPTDLRNLLDGPTTGVHVLMDGRTLIAAALTLDEGPFDPALSAAIWLGWRRPNGHLLPQSLAFHGGCRGAARLRCRRIMRIAVHPAARRGGLGLRLLGHVGEAAAADGADWLGTSFGATADLLAFWGRAGFQPARLGHRREAASGAHAVMMTKGLTDVGIASAETVAARFQADLTVHLAGPLRDLEPALRHGLTNQPNTARASPASDWLRVHGVAHGNRPLGADLPALRRCLGTLPSFGCGDGPALARRFLVGNEGLDEAIGALGLHSRKAAERLLRRTVADLLGQVHDDHAVAAGHRFERLSRLASRARHAPGYRLDRLGRVSSTGNA